MNTKKLCQRYKLYKLVLLAKFVICWFLYLFISWWYQSRCIFWGLRGLQYLRGFCSFL